VLVRVRAAGSGPDVWHIMTGQPYMARAALGFRRPKVRVRGWDVAGTVEAVGGSVTDFRPGDEVMGVAEGGSFAEYAVTSPDKLVPKPANLSFEQAAALPISGVTALQALRDKAHLQSGQTVLVIGAGGGVGTLAVQVAKAFGAHATGVASSSKLDLVRSIGADDVIDYTREDFTDGSMKWDVIVDTAGRRPLRQLRRALTQKGTLVVVGGDGGGRWTGGFFRGMLRGPVVSPFVGQKLMGLNSKVTREDLQGVAELAEAAKLKPVIGHTYALSQTPEAIRELEAGHAAGKLVIAV
jgi:NADPH:quinone reductase-like Zn-dependent oxidoreductase